LQQGKVHTLSGVGGGYYTISGCSKVNGGSA